MHKKKLKKLLREVATPAQRRVVIMFITKLGLDKLSVAEKIELARHVIENMTDNPNFATPTPTLAAFETITDNLENANAAMDGSKVKTLERDAQEMIFDSSIGQLRNYVEFTANGNPTIILTSGMEVRNPRTPSAVLPAPSDLRSASTQFEGEVKLKWASSGSSKLLYIIEMAPDNFPSPTWQPVGESSKATFVVEDLQPGQKYRFRVSVANAAGMSGYSNETSCRPN